MILATLRDLAKTLGCRDDQADDVVRSEPSARAALSRRGLFKAAGAVAAGALFADVPAQLGIEGWLPSGHDPFFGVDRIPLVSFNDLMKRLYPIGIIRTSSSDYVSIEGDYAP